MPPERSPAEERFRIQLTAVRRRLQLRSVLSGLAVAAATAAGIGLAMVSAGLSWRIAAVGATLIAIAAGALAAGRALRQTPRRQVARLMDVEDGHHNLLVTAEELLDEPRQVSDWMRVRVIDAAGAAAATVSPARLVPLSRAAMAAALALVGLVSAVAIAPRLVPAAGLRGATGAVAVSGGGSAAAIRIEVDPPAYTGRAASTVVDPERLEILAGSRVRVRVAAGAVSAVRYGATALPLEADGTEATAVLTPEATGYLAFEIPEGSRRLVPVVVTPDRAPVVTVSAPGKDLLVPQANGRIAVNASATDDYGLRALELSYTRVSGSGEQFEFTEGSLPLEIARRSAQTWSGGAAFVLDRLALEPGDSLVYRVLARDARPGDAGLAVSDTFVIEVAGPGMVALSGFELPPDGERYALSQQMIVLKLERLRAREQTLAREALVDELQGLAAEQRAVRSNFIFLLGGHVEDEEEEAEQSSEIAEGRMQNTARTEINAAIRFMSLAEQAMIGSDSAGALPPAKSAADALQRAFGRNRYFLRTVPVRSRIDPSRRLTGDLAEAADWRRSVEPAEADRQAAAAQALLRDLLSTIAAAAGAVDSATIARQIGALAERALAIDPGSPDWQGVASALLSFRSAVDGPRSAREQRAQAAVAALTPLIRAQAPQAAPASSGDAVLRGAWAAGERR